MQNKITLTIFTCLLWLGQNFAFGQMQSIEHPVGPGQSSTLSRGATAVGSTLWCVYQVFDSSSSASYCKISKYDGSIWTHIISVPATFSDDSRPRVPVTFFKDSLYFFSSFKTIQLAAKTYTNISGIFKFNGTQIKLVDSVYNLDETLYQFPGHISDFEIHNNKLIVVGYFNKIDTTTYNGLAEYDGTNWSKLGTPLQRAHFLGHDAIGTGGQAVYTSTGLKITGYPIEWDTLKYHYLASYNGSLLKPIDSAECAIPNFTSRTPLIYANKDSAAYYLNQWRDGANILYYCRPGFAPEKLTEANNSYPAYLDYNYFADPVQINGSTFVSKQGTNNVIIQKLKGKQISTIKLPSKYFNGIGLIGNDKIYIELLDKNNSYKPEFFIINNEGFYTTTVAGKLFIDKNQNCSFDNGEITLKNNIVYLKNQLEYGVSNNNGDYELPGLDTISDSLIFVLPKYVKPSCNKNFRQQISLKKDSFYLRNMPLQFDSTSKDLELAVFADRGYKSRRYFWENYNLTVKNLSGSNFSGNVVVKLDALFDSVYSTSSQINIIGKTLKCTVNNLNPLDKITLTFSAKTAAALNSNLKITFELDSLAQTWDTEPNNDKDSSTILIVGAYDPNDKLSNPNGNILPGTENVSYHINFQNMGTDTAFRVVVVDSLDLNLPIEKVVVGSSSHPYTLKIKNNILIFTFNNIKLVDKETNEAGSKGYLRIACKLNKSLAIGTQIKNRAHIYFDYNTPITTNTASLLIAVPNNSAIRTVVKGKQLNCYPNPTASLLNVINNGAFTNYKLYTTNGILKTAGKLESGENTLNLQKLTPGIYVLKTEEETLKICIQ